MNPSNLNSQLAARAERMMPSMVGLKRKVHTQPNAAFEKSASSERIADRVERRGFSVPPGPVWKTILAAILLVVCQLSLAQAGSNLVSSIPPPNTAGEPGESSEAFWHYVVRPGDTVWGIAHAHLVHPRQWRELAALHRLPANGDVLLPDQVLKIPAAWLRQQAVGASLVSYSGQLKWWPAGRTAQALQATSPQPELPVGASVQTGPDSSAVLRFADGSTGTLLPDSLLVLDRMAAFGTDSTLDTRLRLERGEVHIRAKPGRKPGQVLRVNTPAAVAAVRGTEFVVLAQEEHSVVATYAGSVEWQAQDKTVTVAQAEGSAVRTDHPPGPVQTLKPAPNLQSWPARVSRLPLELQWPSAGGEAGWRWRAWRDAAQTQVIKAQSSPVPALQWVAPANGVMYLEVASVQPDGLLSLPALHRLEVDVVRELVVQAMPLQASMFEQGAVQTGLPGLANGQSYLVELALDAGFADVVWQDVAERSEWVVPAPRLAASAGLGLDETYYFRAWRLSSPSS